MCLSILWEDTIEGKKLEIILVYKYIYYFYHRGTEPQRRMEREMHAGIQNHETDVKYDVLTKKIIGAAIEVHRHLGPGLLESVYEVCFAYELQLKKLKIERQVLLPVMYKGINLNCDYRIDLIVENEVVIEIKSVKELIPLHEAQLLSYLRLMGTSTGLLINFNVSLLKDGIKRIKN